MENLLQKTMDLQILNEYEVLEINPEVPVEIEIPPFYQ